MTAVSVRLDLTTSVVSGCVLAGVRAPTSVSNMGVTGMLEWLPDLTAQEQTTVNSIVKLAVGSTLLTPAERITADPFLTTGRTLLGMNQSTFTGQTQAQINRQVFDNLSALWRVIFLFIRDS